MMTRRILPGRRAHTVVSLEHAGHRYHIGFGQECNERGEIVSPEVLEVFADARRTGSDHEALLHDACIAISLLIQYGCSCSVQAQAYGELRNEGEKTGPPASILGCITRMAVDLEREPSAT